jgi:hypothetical protein
MTNNLVKPSDLPALAKLPRPWMLYMLFFLLGFSGVVGRAQMGTPTPLSPEEFQKAAAEGPVPDYPQLVNILPSTHIQFEHLSSPEAKYIVESMSGGVALIDYDQDGWPDIYLTNVPSVEIALHGGKARSAGQWAPWLATTTMIASRISSSRASVEYLEPKLLFINQRDGNFKNGSRRVRTALQILQVSRGFAIGDLSNGGVMEAAVENLVGKPMILRPEGEPPDHWISFELRGVESNRAVLNARTRATAGVSPSLARY